METVFPFKTKNGNYYIYFLRKQMLVLSNKQLNAYAKECIKGKFDLGRLIVSSTDENYNTLNLLASFLSEGYFIKIDTKRTFSGKLSNPQLKNIRSNIKQIAFELTERCNFKCTYCGYGEFYSASEKRARETLNVKDAISLLNYLATLWNSENNNSHNRPVYLSFYGGEPLLEFNAIKEIINYTKQIELKHNYFIYNMTTNGVYLKKHIAYLVEHDVMLLISLDGGQSNNKYRKYANGKEAFQDIVSNVLYVKNNYPAYFEKNVNFNAVLHNLNTVEDIKQFIHQNFGKLPTISELNTSGIKESKKKEFWNTYKNYDSSIYESEDYKMLENELFLNTPVGVLISNFFNRDLFFNKQNYNELFIERIRCTFIPTGTCLPMSKKIFVTATGLILPCERISHEYSIGKIRDGVTCFDLKNIENRYNKYYEKLLKTCSKCYNIFDCLQCMFYLNLGGDSIKCNGFTSYKSYTNKLRYIVEYLEENPEKQDWIQKEYEYSF